MKTIKNYLPIFQGFYGTIFEANEEQEIDIYNEDNGTDLNYDDFKFDYKNYEKRVGIECVGSIETYLKHDGFSIEIEFDKIYNPRQYNFTNDAIYCTYKVSDEDFNTLLDYCKENLTDFKAFLEENYSSYDGFTSFYSTDVKKWFNEYLKDDSDDFENCFVGILKFYLENEGYDVEDMYSDVDSEFYLDYELIKE